MQAGIHSKGPGPIQEESFKEKRSKKEEAARKKLELKQLQEEEDKQM